MQCDLDINTAKTGAHPAFQHRSDVGTLTSTPGNNVTPVPVVHPASGIQNSMVATEYPGELGVAYSPAQWYPGTTQSQQNFQGLPQLEPQPHMASTGFQHPKHVVRGSVACSPRNNCSQISRKANADAMPKSKQQNSSPLLHSLLNGNPSDFTSFFKTPSFSSEETNADIKLNTSTHFSDGKHCKRQQRKSSPAALNCGKTKTQNLNHSGVHSTPYQKQFASVFLNSQISTDKVLSVAEMEPPTDDQIQDFIADKVAHYRTLLSQKDKNYGHAYTNRDRSFLSDDMDSTSQNDYIMPKSNSNAPLITNSAFNKNMEKKSCAVIEQWCTAAVGQRGVTELTPESKETGDCATSELNKYSTGTLASAEGNSEHAPETESLEKSASLDFELLDKKQLDVTMSTNGSDKLVYLGEDKTFVSSNDENFQSKWCKKYLQNGVTTLHFSLTALKELITSLENVETIAEMDNFPKFILQQYWNGDIDNIHLFASTEYPQIMGNVAATCTKSEDESPKVLTTVPVMTWDELTEKQRSSSHNCSSSKEEYKSSWSNINKNLDDSDQIPDVSWTLKHMTERENGDTDLKPVAEGLVSVQGVTDVSEELQTKTGSVISESKTFEVVGNSNLNLSIDKIQIHNVVSVPSKQSEQLLNRTSCEDARENVGSLHSQIDVSIALSENMDKEQFPFSESKRKETLFVSILKDLQYEDISDDEDMSQVAPTALKKGNDNISFPLSFEDLQYEVISEDENPQIENVYVKRSSPTQVPEPKNKQLRLENESDGHAQSQAQMMTELISDEELIPKTQISPETETLCIAQHCSSCFAETDDGLICPKCERPLISQPNHSVSSCQSSVLKVEDENDDQMDDDWIVIPISMSDLNFEPKDEDQDGTEKVYLEDNETGNKETQYDKSSVPASAASPIEVFETVEKFRQANALQSKIDTLDWSTSECELDSEEEPHPLQNSKESYSEPEDSCETEDSCDYSPEPERHYLTVSKQLLKKRSAPLPPETDDSVSEKEGQDDEVTDVQKGQTRSVDKSCLRNLRQLIEAKAKKKTDDIIILDSDTEDESDRNCKKKRRRTRFSSDSDNSGAAPCSHQKRHSPETVDGLCGTVNQKHQTDRLPFADLPAPQYQSKFHDTQCKEVMQDTCSEMSHSSEKIEQLIKTKNGFEHVQHDNTVIILDSDTDDDNDQNYKKANRERLFASGSSDGVNAPCGQQKSEQLIEPKGFSEYVQHKTNRQTMSDERRNTKRILSSASEDSDDALFATKNRLSTETENRLCGTANQRTKNPRRSSDKSLKKQLQSVGNEANSILDSNPVIPRLVIQKSSQSAKFFKLSKESRVHMQGKDETHAPKTLTETSKNTDSCEKNTKHLNRDEKGRFLSKPKPANGRQHSTKSVIQANKKPIQVSRQLSSPSQEVHFTSTSSSSSPRGQLSEARQSLASSRDLSHSGKTSALCSPSKSKQSPLIPRQHSSSKLPLSHSNSSPSTLDHPCSPTNDPLSSTTMQSSARKRVNNLWTDSYFTTRRDRKSNLGMEKNLRTTNYVWCREARPGPSHHDRTPRKRHALHESETPLMKKTKSDARQWTKAINRDTPRKRRYSVGDGYKWSEKPTLAKPTKGSGR